ncbi:MAG: hypothetical protein QM715_04620 [Nibricoccus sp.]
MKNVIFHPFNKAKIVAGLALFTVFAGCASESSSGYRGYSRADTDFQDDYDYFPEYETYYSYRRREFVYLDGGVWVRRPAPPHGTPVNVILAAPSVRLDFHDAPERHHNTVVRSYPRTWRGPDKDHPVNQERSAPPTPPPERRDVRPEPPPEHQNRHHEGRNDEHRESRPEHPVAPPTPPQNRPEHPDGRPKPPNQKKVEPREERPQNQSEQQDDDHKRDRKDDKPDDDRRPNR